jgi:DNA-3-methyladenine glycosylase
MRRRRGLEDRRILCSGPGRLGQALGVTKAHDGLLLSRPPFSLQISDGRHRVVSSTRIGIASGQDIAWRFTQKGSRFLSRP